MKIVNGLTAAFILAAACSLPAHAQQYCSEQSLRGEYGSYFSGQILTGPLAGLVNGITLETFDGYGSFVSKDHVVLNGAQPAQEWRESSGTYTINPDCTGKKQVNFANNNPPPRITYFVITNSGDQLVTVGGNSGAALSGVYIRRNEGHDEKHR
jgi:hypothetical protein